MARKQNLTESNVLADTLRQAIVDSGLTVYAIAKGSSVSQPVVHRFMAGERDLTLGTASRLCTYLKLRLTPSE